MPDVSPICCSSTGSLVGPALAGYGNDSWASTPYRRRPFVFKSGWGPPDRGSPMERGLHDRSRPQRVRRADVDLRSPQRDVAVQERVL